MPSSLSAAQAAAMVQNAQGQLPTQALQAGFFNSLGQAEIVDWTLYDNQTIAAGTQVPASISLFQTAAGGVSSKTPVQTNMSGQGVLPASQAFVVTGISVTYAPYCSFLDIVEFGINSYFQFQVSNKVYLQLPTFEIPGGSVPVRNAVANQGTSAAIALLAGSTSAGTPSRENVYKFRYPIPIWVQEQFIVTFTTPGPPPTLLVAASAAAPTVDLDTAGVGLNFWVNLHGILYRNVR